jgi:hypothetical protein
MNLGNLLDFLRHNHRVQNQVLLLLMGEIVLNRRGGRMLMNDVLNLGYGIERNDG